VNALIRGFLDEYAAVPERWREGLPPPWTPDGRMAEVLNPTGAGLRASQGTIEGVAEALGEVLGDVLGEASIPRQD
jgi:hypothetical protein